MIEKYLGFKSDVFVDVAVVTFLKISNTMFLFIEAVKLLDGGVCVVVVFVVA